MLLVWFRVPPSAFEFLAKASNKHSCPTCLAKIGAVYVCGLAFVPNVYFRDILHRLVAQEKGTLSKKLKNQAVEGLESPFDQNG